MSNRYDLIVIGAGTNGLACATLLAKKGRKVLVVDKGTNFGGLAAAEEFHPGFKTAGTLNDTTGVRSWVAQALDLEAHGLKFKREETPIFAPARDGRGLLLWRNPQRAEEEIAPLSLKDAKAYADYRTFLQRIGPVLRKVFDDFPPDVTTAHVLGLWDLLKKGLSLRLLGKADMMELLRIAPMCVADWLNEWFESDQLKALLAAPAIHNSYTGPWSPGTNANLLLAEAVAGPGVEGGPQAFARSLIKAAQAAGVELRGNAEVRRVEVKDGRVSGVSLAGGETIAAGQVAAAVDPKQLFLKLVDQSHFSLNFARNIRCVRARGTVAKLDLALNAYPEIKGRPSLKAEVIRTGAHVDELERAFDAVKYGEISQRPVLDAYVPSLEAPELAPTGQHVMQVLVHFAPHDLRGGWTAAAKATLHERSMSAIAEFMPDIKRHVVGSRLQTPEDLATRFNLSGGHLLHAEHAADQLLVRPTPECARYATPVPGLFLCGSGAHPGGGMTGAVGTLAAKALLG